MGIGDIFKTGQFKNEIEELKQENARLQGAQLSKIIFGK